ncbi:hypothetical protein E4T47_02545 [Aureobasidium subglaciale]|nr:hypothetical protein E4T47_02545 [Aureobasidium subglaciale]
MAPQSSTPSPRRFLLTKRPQGHTTPTPSRLSNQVLQDASGSSTPRPTSGPTPSQFARVPRFAMSTARRASFPPRSPSPARQQHSALGVVHENARELLRESITIADDDEEMLDTEHANLDFAALTQPISQDSIPEPDKGAYFTSHTPPSLKRRKVDIGDPASTPQPTPGRFVMPSTGTTRMMFTQADGETSSSSSRPAFLMASLPPPESVAPLPDAFSPRRRGQKYIPGGLASELQSWVIEAAQTASQGRPRTLQQVDDSVHVVSVDGIRGNGPVFAHGTISGGRCAKVLLIDGQVNQKAERVKAGDQISIRQPTWDVQVDGEAWTVGVDWRTMKI